MAPARSAKPHWKQPQHPPIPSCSARLSSMIRLRTEGCSSIQMQHIPLEIFQRLVVPNLSLFFLPVAARSTASARL